MKNIFRFLWSPTKHTEDIKNLVTTTKISLIASIVLLYSITTIGPIILGPFGDIFGPSYYIGIFFAYIVIQIIVAFLLFLSGKAFKSKADFLDIFTIYTVAQIPYLIFNMVMLIGSLAGSDFFIVLSFLGILAIIPGIWLIILLIYGVSTLGEISKFKSFVTIILSIIGLIVGLTGLLTVGGLLIR